MSPYLTALVRGEEYTYSVAPEEGILLEGGRRWRGYRLTYRRAPRQPWQSVLLVDHDHWPTSIEARSAIEFHVHGELAEPARVEDLPSDFGQGPA